MLKSRDELISSNLLLVHSLCKRFKGKGIEYDDLYSAGCVGLVNAADRFDESLGFAFSTYAVPVILGEIKRLFRDGGAVKVSRSLKELSLKAAAIREELSKTLGREPSISELAQKLGVSEAETAEALCSSAVPLSLSPDDDEAPIELPVSFGEEGIVEKISLFNALNTLDEGDKRLIAFRYFEHKTQSETAKRLNMTQVQVSRREKKILLTLREWLK
ncbi:MAG: sigma-70 family RNA polymerase sigma factor [Clostridia bacterium]|nr:sigma-70 family RNA polymerase sigma factor [Clostridia bacterium]